MIQKRAYRYRCYPTIAQADVLTRTFGCVRFVYNWALRLRTDAYSEGQERISYPSMLSEYRSGAHHPTTAAGDIVA
jgi:putative transposase